MGSEHDVDPRSLRDDVALVLLCEAAADGDLHAFVFALDRREVPERSVQLVSRVFTDCTGVENNNVGFGALFGRDVSRCFEASGEPF
ncbi:unannotated protein [freshwater metagenome]|uniref:Unannotated protein n=1 Tax=freshwater metagenome TaxID=449393 RepID=A0A6J6G4H0_9ZZZZ